MQAIAAWHHKQGGPTLPNIIMSAKKSTANYTNFEALDIRVGVILDVADSQTKKPTYRMLIDFGPEIGHKVSCGAYKNYTRDQLLGKEVICIVNFGPLKMGPEISEVLVLGVPNEKGETIFLTPQSEVPIGVQVF
jgi:tRNA-binding protein